MTGQLTGIAEKSSHSFQRIVTGEDIKGTCFTSCLDNRTFFLCKTEDPVFLYDRLSQVFQFMKQRDTSGEEPMLNLIVWGSKKHYLGALFPRKAHRPSCYYDEGAGSMLVSPGAVDIGGLIILPGIDDYERMKKETVLNIFSEVCSDSGLFQDLVLEGMELHFSKNDDVS